MRKKKDMTHFQSHKYIKKRINFKTHARKYNYTVRILYDIMKWDQI